MVEKYLLDEGNISEYVVRGGTVECTSGSHPDVLNMPYSHGVFLKDQPQLNITDSVGGVNIISFGACAVTGAKCVPATASNWINLSKTKLHIDEEEALIKNAKLFCTVGGKISIIDSGQE